MRKGESLVAIGIGLKVSIVSLVKEDVDVLGVEVQGLFTLRDLCV